VAQFQGQAWSTLQAKARAEASWPELAAAHLHAVAAVSAKYQAELAAKPEG
jgi:hypothetical protein